MGFQRRRPQLVDPDPTNLLLGVSEPYQCNFSAYHSEASSMIVGPPTPPVLEVDEDVESLQQVHFTTEVTRGPLSVKNTSVDVESVEIPEFIDETTIEIEIVQWDATLKLLEALSLWRSPDYIYIDDKYRTLEMEYNTIFDNKFVSLWIDDFAEDGAVICKIMSWKNGEYNREDMDILINGEGAYKRITKKLKKLL